MRLNARDQRGPKRTATAFLCERMMASYIVAKQA